MTGPNVRVAAYSDFGAKGFKGVEIYHLVRDLWRADRLDKVIALSKTHCRYDFDLDRVETPPGGLRSVHVLGKIRTAWPAFPARWISTVLFDRYAARRLAPGDGILVTTPRLLETTRRAKKLGYTTVLYAADPEPRFFHRTIVEERRALGLRETREDRSRSLLLKRFESQLAHVDSIIAISDFSGETYASAGFDPSRVFVAPLGVDVERFRPTPVAEEGPFTALFMAHLTGLGIVKGLSYLLEAWSGLDRPGARLLVCGRVGAEAREILARFEGRLAGMELLGPVDRPEEFHRRSTVFVFPSVAEGLGKVALEALGSGRPVISTRVTAPLVRDGIDGFYVPARDPHALREKIRALHDHREEAVRMGANAASRGREFTWSAFSRRVAGIVETIDA